VSTAPSRLGLALQLTDVVRQRAVGGRTYPATVADAGAVVDLARHVERHFSTLLLTDNIGYRNTTVLLGAVAAATSRLGLGTFTSFPYGRSPLDTATGLATLRELMGRRNLAVAFSRGSGAVTGLYRSERPLRYLSEYLTTVRTLLAGGAVETDRVPELARVHALRPGVTMASHVEPCEVPLLISSTGPRGLRLAGQLADGVQFVTQQPTQSMALLAEPDFDARSGLHELDAAWRAAGERPFRRMYGVSVSIADDPDDAVEFARRQVAGLLSTKSSEQLAAAGLDPDLASAVRAALRDGGLAAASRSVPRSVVARLVVTGRPDEVADQVCGAIELSRKWGFDEHFLCFPLGPDLKAALTTIVRSVLPAVQ
jgi:alkanesulfonate monooxygenase SsuD/methylene tetrahydromethanopterin reductase-like flavin-dependent oxidoreductase (luciferase family)